MGLNVQEELLVNLLSLAVPIVINGLSYTDGPTEDDLTWLHGFSAELGAHGDAILYYIPKRSGDMFSKLARALGTLAYQPGGVTYRHRHWCTGTPDSNGDVCHAGGMRFGLLLRSGYEVVSE